jgi:hypothetical protein
VIAGAVVVGVLVVGLVTAVAWATRHALVTAARVGEVYRTSHGRLRLVDMGPRRVALADPDGHRGELIYMERSAFEKDRRARAGES